MKKIYLLAIISLLFVLNGCVKDRSLFEEVYNINISDVSEEDLLLIDQGTYSKSFILTSINDVTNWIEENDDEASNTLVEDLSNYEDNYFEDNLLVVAYVTYRAYSSDFCIKKQELQDNILKIEIQYYIPWYAFGDSWPEVYALMIELPKGETEDISVEVIYVER